MTILRNKKGIDGVFPQILLTVFVISVVIITLLPLYVTILLSLKSSKEILASFWALPHTWMFSNYSSGFLQILPNMLNSVVICLISDACTILLSAFSAFVFSRNRFFGKEFLFILILSLMIIPSTVTLTPSYLNIINLGLKDNWLGLILPYIAGNQIASIFLFRTFMGQHPDALYEAARIDGAGDFTLFFKICLPMSLPILIVQAVALFAAIYNDFMWPMLIMDTPIKSTLMPQLKLLASNLSSVTMQTGTEYAVYLLSGIPLVITTILGMKYYINGDFAAGLKL